MNLNLIPDDAPMPISERIVEKIISDIRAMVRSDDGSPLFKDVQRGDPNDIDIPAMKTPGAYIEDSDDNVEATLYTQLVVAREFSIIVHIRFTQGQRGVDPYKVFQYYKAKLQELLLADNYIRKDADGQPLGLTMYEVGHSPEVFTQDALQGGSIVFRAKYRHERSNPYVSR